MGLIKTIFGGVFGLIGSLFKAIAGIFGLGKKGEFYMELEADQSASPAAATPSTPAPQPAASETAAPVAETQSPAAASTKTAPEPRVISQASSSGNPVVSKPVVEVSQPASPVATNFATDYLVNPKTNSTPRRRPGPSVSPFKDMGKKSPSMG